MDRPGQPAGGTIAGCVRANTRSVVGPEVGAAACGGRGGQSDQGGGRRGLATADRESVAGGVVRRVGHAGGGARWARHPAHPSWRQPRRSGGPGPVRAGLRGAPGSRRGRSRARPCGVGVPVHARRAAGAHAVAGVSTTAAARQVHPASRPACGVARPRSHRARRLGIHLTATGAGRIGGGHAGGAAVGGDRASRPPSGRQSVGADDRTGRRGVRCD